MLVLSRKAGQEITMGSDVKIKVLQIRGNRVRLGIVAPPHLAIHRGEVQLQILAARIRMNPTDVPPASCADCEGM